jgi:hypothetical protein
LNRPCTVISALALALWIAICAAAPESIWQGRWIVAAHLSRADLLSVLIGLVLAFFVEPLMERARHLEQSGFVVMKRPPMKPHKAG